MAVKVDDFGWMKFLSSVQIAKILSVTVACFQGVEREVAEVELFWWMWYKPP